MSIDYGKEAQTPGARWRADGKPDPHGLRYDCDRAQLAGGHMTDDEVANAVYLDPNIGNLTIAKDRIRWLSRQVEALLSSRTISAEVAARGADEIDRLRAALTLVAGFKRLTLFSYTRSDDGNKAYMDGSHAAFEQAADIAQGALGLGDQQSSDTEKL